jgi:hypothetical protein
VEVGKANTLDPLPELKLPAGDQEYVFPPLAVSKTESPLQMLPGLGLTRISGRLFTVTVIVLLEVQPLPSVPVIV